MNASSILNQLMKQAGGQSSGSSAGGGMDVGKMMSGLSSQFSGGKGTGGIDLKSLLGGGALGLMIGSKRGRKMGGKAIKYGALAGVGFLAWKAYQKYQADGAAATAPQASAQQGQPLEQLQGQAQEQRGLEILQAMIMAARADGHIDANERAMLTQEIETLGPDDELHAWIQQQFDAPLDADALAHSADSPQAGREIYLVSAIIVDEQNPMERAWLDQLAKALGIPPDMAKELDRQVEEQIKG
ncbi:tellurite resistance TerB family protein [Gilvimarinus algae]|uniref:Tellurite resistance TerB family protein n=1 Tax=Gilvimarinus algae TaxID=3058037 RepID=A0ABT8TK63_9GAMM|nr:tellurite resistance TerB family protein [Gilvimarinus sp. SDUM040014]MDO3383753.1 tellurite resistance TerB family protein [Gilvimarinus sp. SDUM040014]